TSKSPSPPHRSSARCGLEPQQDRRSTNASPARLPRCGLSSVAFSPGVTIHVGLGHLFYAWPCQCDRDLQVAAHTVQLLRVDPSVDHPVTVRTNPLERAGGVS